MPDKIVNHFVLADGSTAKYSAGSLVNLDETVSLAGYAPDAKAVGDRLTDVENLAETLNEGGLELKDDVIAVNVEDWLDDHPEATTTVQDDSLTTAKYKDGSVTTPKLADGAVTSAKADASFLKEIKNAYVTPQMYGAIGDGVEDDSDAIQSAVDSGKTVVIPTGKYFISKEIVIDRNGVTILGCGMEENETMIETNGTNAFHIKSGHRIISIKDICLNNIAEDCAGVEISGTGDSTHFIEMENVMINRFKYGILAGGVSTGTGGDGKTYLWNCSFKNIKINSLDHTADRTGIKIMYNGGSNFGLVFERVYINGYKYVLNLAGCECVFTSCNFGLNSVDAVRLLTVSRTKFIGCNFECDHKVTGSQYQAVISAGYRTTFDSCSFITELSSVVSMLYWGSDYYIVFSQCTWKAKSGDEMTDFYSKSIASQKYSLMFAGGNESMPRPDPFAARSLQVLDMEMSKLPKRSAGVTDQTGETGEMQYDISDRIGNRPIWHDGTNWRGGVLGEWCYLDGVQPNGTVTYTVGSFSDRPRTCLVTVRGNRNDVYYLGLLSVYRDADLTLLTPIAQNRCTVTNNLRELTITNGASNQQQMYVSVLDLM